MNRSRFKLDPILNITKESLEKDLDHDVRKDLRRWSSWIVEQRVRFKKGHITPYHYFISVRGIADFLRRKLKVENEIISKIIENNYCQVCLTELNYKDIDKGVCPTCRMPVSKFRENINTFDIPESRDMTTSIKYSFELYFRPIKIFSYHLYDVSSWLFTLIVFSTTVFLTTAFTIITLPKLVYSDLVQQAKWASMFDSILPFAIFGYILLDLMAFIFYSGVFYAITKGSNIRLKSRETIKITSIMIAPRMIGIPLIALLNQIIVSPSYILDEDIAFEQAKYLIFNISEYSGKLGTIVEFGTFIIIIYLASYALDYLWDFQDEVWLRMTPLIFISIVVTFGVPFFI